MWRASCLEGFSLSFFSLLFLGSSSCPRYHAYTFPLGEQFMYILVLEGSENVSKMVPHASLRYAGYGAVEEESFV